MFLQPTVSLARLLKDAIHFFSHPEPQTPLSALTLKAQTSVTAQLIRNQGTPLPNYGDSALN